MSQAFRTIGGMAAASLSSHFFHWCQVCNSLSHDVVRVLQKKQPPTHTRSKGAVRAPLPPTQCWAQRVYTTAFKKNNHFSNRGLPLLLTSTLSWGCRGCCNSTSWCRCGCFFWRTRYNQMREKSDHFFRFWLIFSLSASRTPVEHRRSPRKIKQLHFLPRSKSSEMRS